MEEIIVSKRLAKEGVLSIRPYEPGKPIEEVSRELGIPEKDIIKMASNENPFRTFTSRYQGN